MVKLPHWPIVGQNKIKLTLHNIANILNELDNPHFKLPPVIHVAGTNGKGSTVAFMKAIFEAAGYVTHVYTSPHLVRFNERIKVRSDEISDDFLYSQLEEVRIAAEKVKIVPSFFEGTTIAAFLAFSKIKADIVLMETGLGGRLDATNVIPNPILTIITSISYDHTEYLGNDIRQIAAEKAGIIKKNSACIVSKQYSAVLELIKERASELESELIAFEYDWGVQKTDNGMKYFYDKIKMDLPLPNLIGDHQLVNAGNAITAAINAKGFYISDSAIKKGITTAKWPARLQKLPDGYLTKLLPNEKWEIWVDGAHNNAGAHILASWLKDGKKSNVYLIIGMTKGRDTKAFIAHLKDQITQLIAVPVESEPLSYPAHTVSLAATELNIKNIECESIEDAIIKIKEKELDKATILICGSLYLAGDAIGKNISV